MKTVLLIDDDFEFRNLFQMFLEGTEFDLQFSQDMEAAIKFAESGVVCDVAVVDFWLGTQNSVPLLKFFSKNFSNTSLILVSGGGGPLDLESTDAIGALSGARYFLQKPFRRSDLIEALNYVI